MTQFAVSGFGFAKALIFGEYAVMYGAPGLVMGLSATLRARLTPPNVRTLTPFEAKLCEILLKSRSLACDIELENDEFFDDNNHKLGIGSSAAAVVAVLKAASLLDHRPFSLLEAIQFHRTLQNGSGSGIDVIASALGGLVLAQNCPHSPEITRIPEQNLPRTALFASHCEAPTCAFISAAQKVESTHSYQTCLAQMRELCENMASSVISGKKTEFLEQIHAQCALLRTFGSVIEQPVVPTFFEKLDPIANDCQVTIKPSGAGGGDIFLAMALNASNIDQFARAIPPQFSRIPFKLANLRN